MITRVQGVLELSGDGLGVAHSASVEQADGRRVGQGLAELHVGIVCGSLCPSTNGHPATRQDRPQARGGHGVGTFRTNRTVEGPTTTGEDD